MYYFYQLLRYRHDKSCSIGVQEDMPIRPTAVDVDVDVDVDVGQMLQYVGWAL